MELSIRSQDKEHLIKYDNLYINRNDNGIRTTYRIMTDFITLGIYESKERALEVLDEIQKVLLLKDMYKYDRELIFKGWKNIDEEQIKIVREKMSVYEMPKE